MPETERRRQFASDNNSGICPEAWQALAEANHGHVRSYGDDPWTQRAADLLREIFETDCEMFFVFNGTAANSLALSSCCQSYHSILCHELAHVETDECGAPEFFSNGTKVLLLAGPNGKVDPAGIDRTVKKRTDLHFPKPRVVSVTNATELGTVYRPEELKAIWARTKALSLKLHMDGARFANAVATLGCAPKEITGRPVDVLCFVEQLMGSQVVFFDREMAREFSIAVRRDRRRKCVSGAPWVGLQDGAWLRHTHANAMAALPTRSRARRRILSAPANGVLQSPRTTTATREGMALHAFIGAGCRFMCSWDTQPADVEALAADLRAALSVA
jgi:threonine aldolase